MSLLLLTRWAWTISYGALGLPRGYGVPKEGLAGRVWIQLACGFESVTVGALVLRQWWLGAHQGCQGVGVLL